jgi:hypothetical protein
MTLPVARCVGQLRRAKVPRSASAILGAMGAVVALAACSFGGTQHAAATKSAAAASPSAAATYDPLSGPIEPASALPKTCSSILSDQDLTSAFGSPQVGDTSYGRYAPLPTIGRTGRVTCGFGISVDQFGNAGQPVVTVSVITYDQASRAISRVAADVSGTVAKGATAHPVLVNGHPATVLSKPAAMAASSPSAAASASAPASSSPAASPSATSTASSGGYTELLMADGNRTFVITIPFSKVSGSDAVNVLTSVAALVYQHTLPAGSGSATATPTASPKVSPRPSAS